jgi:chromosome segregation ATPase
MGTELAGGADVELTVRNIGGIDERSMRISSGVTALVGENATNRTSLIQAIAAGLGTDSYTLKSDADAGEVSLTVEGRTYVRKIHRENGHLETEGNPYLDEPDVADLYAVLLESNEIRRAVRDGGDLHEVILDPIDTEEIDAEITSRVDERREIDSELDRLGIVEEELADLEDRRDELTAELSAVGENLERKRDRLGAVERDGRAADDLDGTLSQLRETRAELERVVANLRSERESLESLRETRETIHQQYDALPEPDTTEIATIDERLTALRERQRSLDSTISDLQQVIRFNTDHLDEQGSTFRGVLDPPEEQSVADRLNPGGATVTCWTCGSQVDRDRIEGMMDQLREICREKREEREHVETRLAELAEKLDTLESRRNERADLESRLQTTAEKIEQREETIAEFQQRRETLEDRVAELESTVESHEQTHQDELLALQQEISKLEFEHDQLASKLEDVDAEIAAKREELDGRERLRERRETLSAQLEELRTRIDRIETEAIEAFNTHMAALIDALGYDNVERIWIERTEAEVETGQTATTERQFALHIVRTNEAGEAYEDTVDHLSESEREIVGIVVALAGYLVHDVHEEVPFMLLDSIEMIDGDRLVDLVSYLERFVPYLVVVLLPDHARAFDSHPPSTDYQAVEV